MLQSESAKVSHVCFIDLEGDRLQLPVGAGSKQDPSTH